MRLAALLFWGVVSVAVLGHGERESAPSEEQQTWLTQSRPTSAALPNRVELSSLLPSPQPSQTWPEVTDHLRQVRTCTHAISHPRSLQVPTRRRPWARHGAHIPRMGDDPDPSDAPH